MSKYELASVIIAGVGAFLALIAMIVSVVVAAGQRSLSSQVHRNERLLSQRQMFVQLWPYISKLDEVNPQEPIEHAVIEAANALELVAICWEAEVVDQDLIRRAFAEPFIHMYNNILKTPRLPKGVTGEQLLLNSPAVGRLYRTLCREREERGAIKPITSLK